MWLQIEKPSMKLQASQPATHSTQQIIYIRDWVLVRDSSLIDSEFYTYPNLMFFFGATTMWDTHMCIQLAYITPLLDLLNLMQIQGARSQPSERRVFSHNDGSTLGTSFISSYPHVNEYIFKLFKKFVQCLFFVFFLELLDYNAYHHYDALLVAPKHDKRNLSIW